MDAAQAFHEQLETQRTALTANQLKKQRKKRARLFKQAAASGLVDGCTPSRPVYMEDEREGSVARVLDDSNQDVISHSDVTACKDLPLLSTRNDHECLPAAAATTASAEADSTTLPEQQQQPAHKKPRLTIQHNSKPLRPERRHVDMRAQRGDYSAVMRALQHQVLSVSHEQQQQDLTHGHEVTSSAAAIGSAGNEAFDITLQFGMPVPQADAVGNSCSERSKGPCRTDLSGQLAVINHQLSSEHSSSSDVHNLAVCSTVDLGDLQQPQQQQQQPPSQQQASRKRSRPSCLYGNYHHYYGYRIGPSGFEDPRMKVLSPEWFAGADVLDVGCNEGLLTLALAVGCSCRSMLGVDIDPVLVAKACTNLSRSRTQLTQQFKEAVAARNASAGRHLAIPPSTAGQQAVEGPLGVIAASSAALTNSVTGSRSSCSSRSTAAMTNTSNGVSSAQAAGGNSSSGDGGNNISFSTCQQPGPQQEQPSQQQQQQQQLPEPKQRSLQGQVVHLDRQLKAISRVSFKCGNWLEMSSAANKYGVVTCFSVTKWIHLNWGDDGVMKLFHKFFRCLVPGGLLILEPQPFKSYQSAVHKAGQQSAQFKKVSQLKLRPEGFCDFLTQRVGFELVQQLSAVSQVAGDGAVPVKGFDRPILVLRKPVQ